MRSCPDTDIDPSLHAIETGVSSASSPVVPASFNVTSPVKLVGYRAQFQASSFHLDSGNWPGDEARVSSGPMGHLACMQTFTTPTLTVGLNYFFTEAAFPSKT